MFNQNQIRDFRIATVTAAAALGRPNETAYIATLNNHFYYTVNAFLVNDGKTVLAANGVNAHWVLVGNPTIKDNVSALIAPTANDDTLVGYSVGSRWIDTVADRAYTLMDSTATAAVWKETSIQPYTRVTNHAALPLANTITAGTVYLVENGTGVFGSNRKPAGLWVTNGTIWTYSGTAIDSVSDVNFSIYNAADSTKIIKHDASALTTATARTIIMPDADVKLHKDNLTAIVAPTVTDDNTLGYDTGSRWVDTVTNKAYICVSAALGVALWKLSTAAESPTSNLVATSAPTAANDAAAGYSVNSLWLDTTNFTLYICKSSTIANAVWSKASNDSQDNFTATVAPTTSDDSSIGYTAGSMWIDTATGAVYICLSNVVNAASWRAINTLHNNLTGTVAPTTSNDSSQNYVAGSVWFDTTKNAIYQCINNTLAAAVWVRVSDEVKNNLNAIIAPTVNDSVTIGYAVGSVWVDTVSKVSYICVDSTTTAAVWTPLGASTVKYNLAAIIAPTVTDDSSLGYSINSTWFDSVANDLYICVDSTATAAVWVKVSNDIQHNFTAIVAPTTFADSNAGYSVGSQWVDVIANTAYICVDASPSSAIWSASTPFDAKYDGNAANTLFASSNTVVPAIANGLAYVGTYSISGSVAAPVGISPSTGSVVKIVIKSTSTSATPITITFNNIYKDGNGNSIGGVSFAQNDIRSYSFRARTVSGVTSYMLTDAVPSTPTPALQSNLSAISPPTANDDSTAGYSIGSLWYDVGKGEAYVCSSAVPTAAVWRRTGTGTKHNRTATVTPTVSDDITLGYTNGSNWVSSVANKSYVCVDNAVGAARWAELSDVNYDGNNLLPSVVAGNALTLDGNSQLSAYMNSVGASTVAFPTNVPTNTAGAGKVFKVTLETTTGSVVTFATGFLNSAGKSFGAVTLGVNEVRTLEFRHEVVNGVSKLVSQTIEAPILNNFTAVVVPTGTDDSSLGYSVGSVWIDTAKDHNYTCVDSTVGSAIWKAQPVAPITPRDVMQVKITGNNLFAAPNTAANMTSTVYQSGTSLTNAVGSGVGGLKAGVTYKLTAVFWYPGNAASANFTIRDMTAGVNLTTAVQMFMPTYGMTVETFFTPAVTTEVSLTTSTAGTVYLGAGTSLSVEEVVTFPASASPLDALAVMPNSGTNTVTISNTTTVGVAGKAVDLSPSINNSVYDPSLLITAAGTSIILKNSGRYEFSYGWHAAGIERVELVKNGVSVLYGISRSTAAAQPAETFSGMFDGVAGDVIQLSSDLVASSALEGFSFTLKELPPYTSLAPLGSLPKYSAHQASGSGFPTTTGTLINLDATNVGATIYDPTSMAAGTAVTIQEAGEYLIQYSYMNPNTQTGDIQMLINAAISMKNTQTSGYSGGTSSGIFVLSVGDVITFDKLGSIVYGWHCLIAKQA